MWAFEIWVAKQQTLLVQVYAHAKQACVHAFYSLDFPSTVCGIKVTTGQHNHCFYAVYRKRHDHHFGRNSLVCRCAMWAHFNTRSRNFLTAAVIPVLWLQLAVAVLFTNHCTLISLSFQYADSSPAVLMTTIYRSVIKEVCVCVSVINLMPLYTVPLYCAVISKCDPTISYQHTICITTTLYCSVDLWTSKPITKFWLSSFMFSWLLEYWGKVLSLVIVFFILYSQLW